MIVMGMIVLSLDLVVGCWCGSAVSWSADHKCFLLPRVLKCALTGSLPPSLPELAETTAEEPAQEEKKVIADLLCEENKQNSIQESLARVSDALGVDGDRQHTRIYMDRL